MKIAYLDHAATSPLRPSARKAIEDFWSEFVGNPTGSHFLARKARAYLEQSREKIANFLGGKESEIIFTGSGTESDNLAIKGYIRTVEAGKKVFVSAIEHRAVLNAAKAACEETGCSLSLIPVDKNGVVDLNWINDNLDDGVCFVSVMAVNNEIGTIEPLSEIKEILTEKAPHAVLHTDAVQAACWLDMVGLWQVVEMMSLGAHKFGGPLGIGVLAKKDDVKIKPILHGGSQEKELRAGTQNVAGAIGMAEAIQDLKSNWETYLTTTKELRDELTENILSELDFAYETVERQFKVPGNSHILIDGVEPEELLWLLDESHVCISTGSSCASGALTPSHVLEAIGVTPRRNLSALRMTLGWSTQKEEIEHATQAIVAAANKLREKG